MGAALDTSMLSPSFARAVSRERERRRISASLPAFTRAAWHVVEPGRQFVDGWHLQAIGEHLQACLAGQIRQLIINMPPRHMKSIYAAIMLIAYDWIDNPWRQYLCASYASSLSMRDSVKTRHLIQSDWYRGLFGDSFSLSDDQNAKQRFSNTKAGYRIATSVGAATTGEGGDVLLQDDPHNAIEAQSDTIRNSTLEWNDLAWSTRHNDPRKSISILMMQRLHENDMTGHSLAEGGWDHLCLPAEYDGRRIITSIGWSDPRKEMGEVLWPERFGPEELAKLKRKLGTYGASGQLQQRPDPAGGGVINVKSIQLWPSTRDLPTFEFVIQSYDTAIEDKEINDDTACTAFGVFTHKGRKRCMVLDSWAEKMQYPELRKKVKEDLQNNVYGDDKEQLRARYVLVENKGSGIQVRQDLTKNRLPVVGYNPGSLDKVARARLISPILDDGLVYVMESVKDKGEAVRWAQPLIKNLGSFPFAEHDDLADSFVQGIAHLSQEGHLVIEDDIPDEDEYADDIVIKKGNVYLQ